MAAIGAGFAVIVGGVVGLFALYGALPDFAFAYLEWPLTAYSGASRLPMSSALAQLRDYVFPASILLIGGPAIIAGVISISQRRNSQHLIIIAWGVVALLAVFIQRRFFAYHWTLAMPPLVLLGAVGVRAMLPATATQPFRRTIVWCYLLVLGVRLVAHPLLEVSHWGGRVLGVESPERYERHFGIGGVDFQVARLIRGAPAKTTSCLYSGRTLGSAISPSAEHRVVSSGTLRC